MLATNRLTCNRVLVRGTSLPPLVPTFMAPVHLFASVHAHADSRTSPLVLTRTSRVTSSTSSSLFFFFFFFCFDFFRPFSLDLSPFPHRSFSSLVFTSLSFFTMRNLPRFFFYPSFIFLPLFFILTPSFSF